MNVNGNRYKVINAETGRVASKSTTLPKAKKQIKLLYFIKAGGVPSNRRK